MVQNIPLLMPTPGNYCATNKSSACRVAASRNPLMKISLKPPSARYWLLRHHFSVFAHKLETSASWLSLKQSISRYSLQMKYSKTFEVCVYVENMMQLSAFLP